MIEVMRHPESVKVCGWYDTIRFYLWDAKESDLKGGWFLVDASAAHLTFGKSENSKKAR
jgi:hypothetical protein